MKNLLLLTFLFTLSSNIYSQKSNPMRANYDQIFLIKKERYGDKVYLLKTVNSLKEQEELAGFVNNNKLYLNYLLTNFSNNEGSQQLLEIEDERELQESFIGSLKEDSLFNSTTLKITQKVLNPSFVPDTVSVDDVLNVAVKFFNIKGITDEGYYAGKVCSGINGITATLPERKPHLEAFTFSTIMRNLQEQNKVNMNDEFIAAIREIYKLDLGVEKAERLLRAQGMLFSLMRNNERLKNLLLSEYKKKQDYLPFVISNG